MESILQIENMNISFDVNGHCTHVVKNLSLNLCKGEILAIVGASGSGKTVFSHALMGILPANAHSDGRITYNGAPLTQQARLQSFTLIPQTSTYLDPLMKVSKQVQLQNNPLSEKSETLYPFQCSGGMIRNALFSLAYEKEASVIIADEPTPGLDLATALQTLTQLQDLAKAGKSVILITHDIDLAIHVADRVAVFYDGTVLEIAQREDFTSNQLAHPYTRALFDALPQNGFTPYQIPAAAIADQSYTPQLWQMDASDSTPVTGAITHLHCEGISFRYPCKRTVFQHLNFAIEQGERVAIFARSGYGKSTFAKVLSGYETAYEGQVLLGGHPIDYSGFCPVQLIYQHPERSVNPKWTVEQILNEGGAYDVDLLHRFGIDPTYLNRFPHELSGGELQRICIVRAMKSGTQFLICDEITTMLDAITQANIWHCILHEAARRNMALLVITHNQALAHRVCQRVLDFEHQEV